MANNKMTCCHPSFYAARPWGSTGFTSSDGFDLLGFFFFFFFFTAGESASSNLRRATSSYLMSTGLWTVSSWSAIGEMDDAIVFIFLHRSAAPRNVPFRICHRSLFDATFIKRRIILMDSAVIFFFKQNSTRPCCLDIATKEK